MRNSLITLVLAFFAIVPVHSQKLLFDTGWKFHKGGAQRAEMPEFDDSSWRTLDLPHDWSIEDLPGTSSPFDPLAISEVSGGFTTGGTGWYRKTFNLPQEAAGKRVYILFEGAYMNSDVWINGQHLGKHPYGYTSFWFDVSSRIKDKENIIAVQVKNEGKNSRWYTGSGIYRHVWLIVKEPVHIPVWGTVITTPKVNNASSSVIVKNSIENSSGSPSEVRIVTIITGQAGDEKARNESFITLTAGRNDFATNEMTISKPALWSPESPSLYNVITEIYTNGTLSDRETTQFGLRSIEFSAAKGFLLNGTSYKMKGGCIHHDNGPLGAKAYDRAEERRVELLKASGYNAIRCSHNPPSPAFLDACDRLGMLVIDEAFDMWINANNPYDYHLWFDDYWQKDIESFIRRDINHPSVVMWSIGNEIRGMESPEVIAVEKMLAAKVRELDPTRPVTAAVNNLRPEKDPFFANLDVAGYNYAASGDHGVSNLYVRDHERLPERIMYGSESYPKAAFEAWMPVVDNTFVIGDFVWTAFDYIGEASIGWLGYWQEHFYPWNLAFCGDIDICGWKRPQSFYRDALWKEGQLSLFVTPPEPSFTLNPRKQSWSIWDWHDVLPEWNWGGMENKPMKVTVYSSCTSAELFLNGKSLGRKNTGRDTRYLAEWSVPYAPGELKAVGYSGKRKITESVLRTSGKPASLRLTPDRDKIKADGQDLSYITVEMVDQNGTRVASAENTVTFEIDGPGEIIAVGNANPVSTESYQLPRRKAWKGRCLVVVKSSTGAGKIRLTASSAGLPSATADIAAFDPK
jgi:beta-galactosidase